MVREPRCAPCGSALCARSPRGMTHDPDDPVVLGGRFCRASLSVQRVNSPSSAALRAVAKARIAPTEGAAPPVDILNNRRSRPSRSTDGALQPGGCNVGTGRRSLDMAQGGGYILIDAYG